MTFNEYPDREMMMIDLANTIAGELGEALRTGDRASLCVPGGTTPGPIFDALNDVALDWDRVDVLLNDERWVPEDHDRSNTRLLRQRLLINKAAAAKYVPLYAPTETPEESMEALAAGIAPSLPLSVCLLGMGAGHAHRVALSRCGPSGRGPVPRRADPAAHACPRCARAPDHPFCPRFAGFNKHSHCDHWRREA